MAAVIVTVVIGLVKWLIYTGLLWAMIKVQKLNYNVLGLFGSSLLATALGFIPVVGCYIGWAALVLCLWKCTGAEIAPDVLFTVTIAGALMFCVNLFAIGWMMGNLSMVPALAKDADGGDADMELVNSINRRPWPLNSTAEQSTNAASSRDKSAAAIGGKAASSTVLTAALKLKGVTLNGKEQSALIAQGRQIHDIRVGEAFTVSIGEKIVKLTCADITASSVMFKTDDAQDVRLTFQ